MVSMQTAVIMAEQQAAENICSNVNRGFFSLIRSQISQKIAICRSQVEARLLELRDQSQKLLSVKATMQRDFQMIAVALYQTVSFAGYCSSKPYPRIGLDPCGSCTEGCCASGKPHPCIAGLSSSISNGKHHIEPGISAASGTRAKASIAISAMSRFIQESNQQDRLSASILSIERGRRCHLASSFRIG